jgi:DNA-binding Xre family transcriptional regulator
MKNLLLIHGGPGFDDSYFYPYFTNHLSKDSIKTHSFVIGQEINSYSIDSACDEIEAKLQNIGSEDITILGHSYGAFLVLFHHFKYKPQNYKYIFSNWIYDYSWLDKFIANNKKLVDSCPSDNLKNRILHYCELYFEDKSIGLEVLNRINYNDKLNLMLSHESKAITNLSNQLELMQKNMISISCQNEKLIPISYINSICKRYEIKNYILNSYSHFPFIENASEFFAVIKTFLKQSQVE